MAKMIRPESFEVMRERFSLPGILLDFGKMYFTKLGDY